jgi:hypothetical protein
MSDRDADFTDRTKRRILDRSQGACECHRVPQLPTFGVGCGQLLGPGNTFLEHIVPKELGGGSDEDNGAALTKTCWRIKTQCYDLPAIADAKRQQDRQHGIGGPGRGRRRMRGGRHSAETIGMDGTVRPRLTLTEKLIRDGRLDPRSLPAAAAARDQAPAPNAVVGDTVAPLARVPLIGNEPT